MRYRICLLITCILVQASNAEQLTIVKANTENRPNTPEVITFYALGDWGTGYLKQEPVAIALERNVASITNDRHTPPFAIELGDNIYPSGLPFHKSLNDLIYAWNDPQVINALENTFGQVYKNVYYDGIPITFHVLPGNHDHESRDRKKTAPVISCFRKPELKTSTQGGGPIIPSTIILQVQKTPTTSENISPCENMPTNTDTMASPYPKH